ncbi:MAG: hypothetical protein EXR71_16770 [Myxococcales bacterium]|nr:hypothetical protein [Myxococcales bacterium]
MATDPGGRVYRWDLDKTYLLTDFDSLRGVVRSAMEPAWAKRTVPGATALVRELGREGPGWRPVISIVSGSPTQMRGRLEEKLRLDGVRYDSLVLKDNVSNLRRGRLRAVRGQFGYKLPQLIAGRVGLGSAVLESLFGDDAEIDAVVYSVYADAIAGRIGTVELSRVLEAGGAYGDDIVATLASLRRVAIADAVERIYIRLDKGRPVADFDPLGPRVVPVRTWYAAALVMVSVGELAPTSLASVVAGSALSTQAALLELDDVVQRGHADASGLWPHVGRLPPGAASILERPSSYRPPTAPHPLDYLAILDGFRPRV